MPLPPALAARLQKRGIITKPEKPKKNEEVEEVFAEDYDDPTQIRQPDILDNGFQQQKEEEKLMEVTFTDGGQLLRELPACPNRSNPFHECVEFCDVHWGKKQFVPSPDIERLRIRMLTKYPLPPGWQEVADPITNRCYYWHMENDLVSWLAPTHPRAKISYPFAQRSPTVEPKGSVSSDEEPKESSDEDELMPSSPDSIDRSDSEDDNLDDNRTRERQRRGDPRDVQIVRRESNDEDLRRREPHSDDEGRWRADDEMRRRDPREERDERQEGRLEKRRKIDKNLDPMDPAAYSDIPKGGWSAGLERRGVANTGADVTASGPLFQQRPYPSPGAVLKMNKGK